MTDKKVQIKDLQGNLLFPKTKSELVFNADGGNLGTVESGAQVNKIEKIKVNGVELSIVSKEVDITVPESYTKTEADTKFATKDDVSSIPKFGIKVVAALPTEGEDATVYLVKSSDNSGNLYDEYIYVNDAFELLGSQELDISGKQDALTADQLAAIAAVANKANSADVYTKNEVDTELAKKSNAADVYSKTDADSTFQTKLSQETLTAIGTIGDKANANEVYTKTEIDGMNLITYDVLA